MEVTISDKDQETKRICQNCSAPIEKGNAKRQYCSDNCKVAHHRQKQAQAIRFTEQMVKQKEDRIQELESKPIKRISSVRVTNPAWQLANQACTVQAKVCLGLETKLKDLQLEDHKIKSASRGAFYGAATGFGLGLFWITALYDDRQDKKLSRAFLVGSLFVLIVMGIIGYWIGHKFHSYLLSTNEGNNIEIAQINLKREDLERKLNEEHQSLSRLQSGLGKLNQYESEVITSIDDIRE